MSVMWHEISGDDNKTPAVDAALPEKTALIGRIGLMFLSSGAGAFRVRAAMNKVSRALGVTCNAEIGLKSVNYTCIEGGETFTDCLSGVSTGVNTDRIHHLEYLCDSIGEKVDSTSVGEFHLILDDIEKKKGNYPLIISVLAAGMACAAFSFLLGGGLFDMICTFFAAALGFFVRKISISRHHTFFLHTSEAVLTACFTYIGIAKLLETVLSAPTGFQAGYICSMLFVIPGFPLVTGGIDLAKLDIRSGIERITYALLIICVATMTAAFSTLALKFSPAEFTGGDMPAYILFMLRFVMSFAGVFGFSIIFNSPVRMASLAGIIGAVANSMRFLLADHVTSPATAAFFAALAAGLMASAIKRFIGYPRITITVPSIVIMVPGMLMYKGIYFFASGNYAEGFPFICRTALVVTALPLGLVFARILTDRNFRKSS